MPNYTPSPTGQKFIASDKKVTLLLGPVGGGKSTDCCFKAYITSMSVPVCTDGIRRSRGAIVRNTYPELTSTTIKTWKMWFPEDKCGKIKQIFPLTQVMDFVDEDGVRNIHEIMFLALNGDADVKKLLSLELTWLYFNELREISEIVFENAITRIPRYPSKSMLPEGSKVNGIIFADTNAPSETHWTVEKFMANPEQYKDYELFTQPSPLIYNQEGILEENPNAENIQHLNGGYKYYWDIYRNVSPETFKVMVMCLLGSTFDGKPVYPEYNPEIHRSKIEIMPEKGTHLVLGWDFGGAPTCVITQTVNKQFRVLDEIICPTQIGIEEFVDSFVIPLLSSEKYSGIPVTSKCDPSGKYYIQVLKSKGLNATSGKTNDVEPRIETVKKLLSSIANGQPSYQLSITCKIMHQAKVSGYRYREIRDTAGRKSTLNKPEKNEYSHPSDCEQYAAMDGHYFKSEIKSPEQFIFANGQYMRL